MVLFVALTWYSHQKENNPFRIKEHISVLQKENRLFIAFSPKNLKTNPITIITLENAIPCLDIMNKSAFWDLFSGYRPIDSFCPQSIPRFWTSLDTTAKSIIPQGWPQPVSVQSFNYTTFVSAKVTSVLSDGTTGYSLQIGDCNCLIIDTAKSYVEPQTCGHLKEKIELLIVLNQSSDRVKLLRSEIRPRYLITTAQNSAELKDFTNILYFGNSSEFEFEIQSKKLKFKTGH